MTIFGDVGADSIENSGENVTVASGVNNDTVDNTGSNVYSVFNSDSNVTIVAGKGNDQISLSSDAENVFIQYTPGDGNDTIWGLGASTF